MDLQELIIRAWAEPAFKETLLANPKTVIEDFLGVSLPPDVNVYIHEETATDIHLVLPRPPSSDTNG